MDELVQNVIERSSRPVFGRAEAALWSGREGAALDALLKRAVNRQDILRFRRGVYGLSPRFSQEKIHPFVLAQYLYGPSYISLESALSFYGWIPEAVYTVASASMNRSKSFDTPVGLFSFTRIPQHIFYAGVRSEQVVPGRVFLIASPLKALMDYCYVRKLNKPSVAFLQDSLRIEAGELEALTPGDFDELVDVYPQGRVLAWLEGLRKELSL